MNQLHVLHIEEQLKKRHQYTYKWFRKQNDVWDAYSNFIYETHTWETLIQKIAHVAETQQLDKNQIFQYAANRWYNFLSATAVEHIFASLKAIEAVAEKKDIEKDFYLFNIPFDHKTSVFPKQFNKTYAYAQNHKPELIEWFYKNQSTQKRHHYKNRLFIVVYDKNGEHWKLKAEINLLKNAIEKYVASFRPAQLHSFTFVNSHKTYSDIIWVSK